jgi:hypothetical protein
MRRAVTSCEQVIIVLAVMALLCVAVEGVLTFRTRWLKTLDERANQATLELSLTQKLLGEKDAIAQAEDALSLDEGRRPAKDIASLMSELDALARGAGIVVTNLRPASGGDSQAVALLFEGAWPAVVTFLSAAQSRPHFLDIRELRIIRKDPDQKLKVECVFSVVLI